MKTRDYGSRSLRQSLATSEARGLARYPGVETDYETPFFDHLTTVVARHNPGATVLPTLMLGGGDIRHAIFAGATGYGFFPLPPEPGGLSIWELAHSRDERITVENLARCVRYLWDVVCLESELDEFLSPSIALEAEHRGSSASIGYRPSGGFSTGVPEVKVIGHVVERPRAAPTCLRRISLEPT